MAVTVSGIVSKEMGGLKESLGAFRRNVHEDADAILNITGIATPTGQPVDKDDPRMPYVMQPYPKMVYHADGREVVVDDERELKMFQGQGFRTMPYIKPQIQVLDPATEKKELLDTNRQLQTQITLQNERLAKLEELLAKKG